MLDDAAALALSAVLAWVMILIASTLKSRMWTPAGMLWALGNREKPVDGGALADRADRAAKNMLENLVLLVAILAAVHFAGADGYRADLGATVFFWARVLYAPVYYAGIPVLRTAAWSVGVAGMITALTALPSATGA